MNDTHPMSESNPPVVEMRGISKQFGGIHALTDVDLSLRPGEIQGLIGENGAGKSTLIKILAGAYRRDAGDIEIAGQRLSSISPRGIRDHGIAIIYQEFMLAPDLSVAESLFLDELHEKGRPYINWRTLERRASEMLESVGFGHIDPRQTIQELTVAEQQIVEICKALASSPQVIVFDEPTAVLTASEARTLLDIIRRLKDDGVAVLYVSHRLPELFEICDRITVLKDGRLVDSLPTTLLTEESLIRMMVGRDLQQMFPPRDRAAGREVLRVEHLESGARVKDASFVAHAGEIVGFAGLVGSGRTELMRAVFGADRHTSGSVYFDGVKLTLRGARGAVSRGIGLVPEDRKHQGLIQEQSIRFNTAMVSQTGIGFISPLPEGRRVRELLSKLGTKYGSIEDPVSSLSGGNQQKVSVAKWLARDLKLIILDEPTRGVDVGAKGEIYRAIGALANEGFAVVVVSSELPEVIGLCDRVYVMREGFVVTELTGDDINEEEIMQHAMGAKRENCA
ncbi:sugar ABC transporter ATP-binding protein [Microbacterium keratanolyticum]